MLALDRQVAAERGLNIPAIEASMDDLSCFAAAEFDIVIQPVSSCYIPDIARMYREVGRVIVAGGVYISQHKQPGSLQQASAQAPAGTSWKSPIIAAGRCRRSPAARIARRGR